jgi:hypothetical protein
LKLTTAVPFWAVLGGHMLQEQGAKQFQDFGTYHKVRHEDAELPALCAERSTWPFLMTEYAGTNRLAWGIHCITQCTKHETWDDKLKTCKKKVLARSFHVLATLLPLHCHVH